MGANWTRTELKLFGKKFKSIYVGKYNGTEFPVDKIINYDCVFSPFHFSIAPHFPDGVNDEHSSNPYLPKDKDNYYVSIVKKDNRYGMIDSNGNIILQICYQVTDVQIKIGNHILLSKKRIAHLCLMF